jgi:hypothetical protein
MVVELGLDASNEDVIAKMRLMKLARERRAYAHVIGCVAGFDDDPRDLWKIPEARAFARRLMALGFGSFLDPSSLCQGDKDIARGLGLLEVHMIAEGLDLTDPDVIGRTFLSSIGCLVREANDIADAALGPFVES